VDQNASNATSQRHFSPFDPLKPVARASKVHPANPRQPFRPLPPPIGPAPYHLSLDNVLPADQLAAIRQAGRMVFHVIGDTGGVKSPQPQQIVAMHLVYDLAIPDPAARPVFFYHLGDVVYFYGEANEYYAQFYEPYQQYNAPIFAIPGNHDGDLAPNAPSNLTSLAAFVENFCAREPRPSSEAGDSGRDAMTQPNVFWTLETPLATIVGLYTNVPEGGEVHSDQVAWLEAELQNAPKDRCLVLATHHPVYSLDEYHSGSATLKAMLDDTFLKVGRVPDLILAGHVHNYQRFTRVMDRQEVPYVVAGAGGYWHLHYMSSALGNPIKVPIPVPDDPNATLESYCDNYHGYLTLDVTAAQIKGIYTPVPRPQDRWTAKLDPIDLFTLDLREHRLAR